MAKHVPEAAGKKSEQPSLPSRVDADMLLQEVHAVSDSLSVIIANIRRISSKGSGKAMRHVAEAIDGVEDTLNNLIPGVIRSKVHTVIQDEHEFQPVWEEISKLVLKAKNAAPYDVTKPLQRGISRVFTGMHDHVRAALSRNTPTDDLKKENGHQRYVATVSLEVDEIRVEVADDEEMLDENPGTVAETPSPHVEGTLLAGADARDESAPSLQLSIDAPGNSLVELLAEDGLETLEKQAEYIKSKFLFETAKAFGEFLTSIRKAPCNYGEKTSESDAKILLKLYAELERVVTEAIMNGPLSLNDIKARLKSSLVSTAFDGFIKHLHAQVAEEFELFPLEALATVWDHLLNDEDLYLNLSEIHAESAFRTVEDIVFALQWETIEKGQNAPLTKKQQDFFRAKFPSKLREMKRVRSNPAVLKRIATDFNRAFFGGYVLRDESFILDTLNMFIARADKPQIPVVSIVQKVEIPDATQMQAAEAMEATDVVQEPAELPVADRGQELSAEETQAEGPTVIPSPLQQPEEGSPRMELAVEVAVDSPTLPPAMSDAGVTPSVDGAQVDLYKGFTRQEIELACEILGAKKIKRTKNMPKSLRKEVWKYVNEKLGRPKPEDVPGHRQWDLVYSALALNELAEKAELEEPAVREKSALTAEDLHLPSDREVDAARKMFRRDLLDGSDITTARLDIYLAGINVHRFRAKLPVRDRQFAKDLIAGLRSPVAEIAVETLQGATPVSQTIVHGAHISVPQVEADVPDGNLQASIAMDATELPPELSIADDVTIIEQSIHLDAPEAQTAVSEKPTIIATPESADLGTITMHGLLESIEHVEVADIPIATSAEAIESVALNFSRSLQLKLSESLQLAEDSIQASLSLLVDVEEQTGSLRANVEFISGSIGNLLGVVFNENVRALLNTARIPVKELAEGGRLQQVSDEVRQVLSSMHSLIQLRDERDQFAKRAHQLLESHRDATLNAQRAFAFYRQANREIVAGLLPIEVLEDDQRQRVEAIEEFRHRLNDSKTDLEDILVTHLDTIQLEIEQSSLGGTMGLDEAYKAFENEAKKLNRALPKKAADLSSKGNDASEALDTLELSHLQVKLMQMLAIVSGERHPRNDTWGKTSGTLIKYWRETFEDEVPTNQQIVAALTDPKLCENMMDYRFDGRPHRGTMKPLREVQKPLVCWTFDGNVMFMPTYMGYEYMESTHQSLSEEQNKALGGYIQQGKDFRKKLKKKKKA